MVFKLYCFNINNTILLMNCIFDNIQYVYCDNYFACKPLPLLILLLIVE